MSVALTRGKKIAELKSPAKSEKLLTLEKPVAVAQWIAQVSQLWGFDIARFLFIFLSNSLKV
ncbi:hypothetical protein [Fibrobacter sp.]|uniref:hypothetical protein n=1 Tax=Fibrobacter sp. TaxID=35828 RepID=UPI0025BE06CA|nr:hypothetical protein [Fibrobacter sp.]MBS7272024.1 hypothetical protein [Fibrobacter sp.]MCI6437453.1 hypothetical protein [Fibrobacter sp.]MDD7498157.1 hypothetical protein [Fibrobacter sp.]MDY5725053.1 hypothetical protein [Fibrobacter sp.]